jgi:hypothetical protein
MLHVIGLLALSLLITGFIALAVLVLISGFAYWLAMSPISAAIRLRNLFKQPIQQPLEDTNQDATTDSSNDGGHKWSDKDKRLVYVINPSQSVQEPQPTCIAKKRGRKNLTRAGENMCAYYKEDKGAKHTEAGIESPSPTRPFHIRRHITFPVSHILAIVNKLRRRVNQSGKEPWHFKPPRKMQTVKMKTQR